MATGIPDAGHDQAIWLPYAHQCDRVVAAQGPERVPGRDVQGRPFGAVVLDGKGLLRGLQAGWRDPVVCIGVLDAETASVLNTIKVGTRPWGIAVTPDGKYLYAANGPSDDVSVVDLKTDKEVAKVKAGQSPWGVCVVPLGK